MISKILSLLLVVYTFAFQSCERKEIPFSKINTSTVYHFGDTLIVSNNFNLKVNGREVALGNKKIVDSALYNIGINTLLFSIDDDGEKKYVKRKIIVYPSNDVKDLNFEVVSIYEHGRDIYTEGLELYDNEIYESGGEYKKSKLIKYPKKYQSSRQEYIYPDEIFAEGVTVLNDTLYGLSYREHKIFRFNPRTLQLIDSKSTPIDFEGWGLTNDGKSLIVSDGSNSIYYLNPHNYTIKKILQVFNIKGKVAYVNELEYVDGLIYANIFTKENIIIIDSKTGAVLYNVNLSDICFKHKHQGVLNGIAKLENGNFLITGKHWDKMYEITIHF
jgi:glutamine cyclotransferase